MKVTSKSRYFLRLFNSMHQVLYFVFLFWFLFHILTCIIPLCCIALSYIRPIILCLVICSYLVSFYIQFKQLKMGQQCCQAALDDDSMALKALMIKQAEYQKLQNYEPNDPFLSQRINNIQEKQVFKHRQLDKYFFGNWETGYANGEGSMYVPGTLFYKGQFSEGVPDQKGKIQYINRDQSYEGQFLNGKASGKGSYKNTKKNILFQGMWLNSFPQNGTLTFEGNPTINLIRFLDYKQGDAVIQYKDGRQYRGKISTQNFRPQGHGRLTFFDKSFYQGYWNNGFMHGEGVYQWPDGSSYAGSYLNGKKQGYGVFKYSSGKRYEGNWTNGKQQGYGKIVKGQNQEKVGIWKQGKFEKQTEKPLKHSQQNNDTKHERNPQKQHKYVLQNQSNVKNTLQQSSRKMEHQIQGKQIQHNQSQPKQENHSKHQ